MEEVGKNKLSRPAAEHQSSLLDRLAHLWVAATSGIVKHGFAIEYRDLEPIPIPELKLHQVEVRYAF